MKITSTKKFALVGALALVPAMAFTATAEAAPRNDRREVREARREVREARQDLREARRDNRDDRRWDNDNDYRGHNGDDRRWDNRNDYRWNNNRNSGWDNRRYDYDRRDHDDNDTGKLLGAGIIGAIIGAVVAR